MPLSRRRLAAGAAVTVLLVAAVAVSPAAAFDALGALLGSPWFPAALVGLYLVRPFLAWPVSVLSALVGFRYGLAVGLPVALAGAVVTSLIPYAAAGRFRPTEPDGALAHLTDGSSRYFGAAGDVRGVVAARLAPTPAEAISAAAGLAGVSLPAFVVGTLLGELPWTVAAVFVGASTQRFSPAAVEPDPWLVGACVALAGLLLARPTYRWYRARRPA